MTEEQKAIERLKQLPVTLETKHLGGAEDIETVLNLIQKQQEEIENWKMDYNHRCQLAIDRKIEIEKKDKRIDLMSDFMLTHLNEVGMKIICKNSKCTYVWKENTPTGARNCGECIKEYFKKKVEDNQW